MPCSHGVCSAWAWAWWQRAGGPQAPWHQVSCPGLLGRKSLPPSSSFSKVKQIQILSLSTEHMSARQPFLRPKCSSTSPAAKQEGGELREAVLGWLVSPGVRYFKYCRKEKGRGWGLALPNSDEGPRRLSNTRDSRDSQPDLFLFFTCCCHGVLSSRYFSL